MHNKLRSTKFITFFFKSQMVLVLFDLFVQFYTIVIIVFIVSNFRFLTFFTTSLFLESKCKSKKEKVVNWDSHDLLSSTAFDIQRVWTSLKLNCQNGWDEFDAPRANPSVCIFVVFRRNFNCALCAYLKTWRCGQKSAKIAFLISTRARVQKLFNWKKCRNIPPLPFCWYFLNCFQWSCLNRIRFC